LAARGAQGGESKRRFKRVEAMFAGPASIVNTAAQAEVAAK
jgi:hypothetical protein